MKYTFLIILVFALGFLSCNSSSESGKGQLTIGVTMLSMQNEFIVNVADEMQKKACPCLCPHRLLQLTLLSFLSVNRAVHHPKGCFNKVATLVLLEEGSFNIQNCIDLNILIDVNYTF